MIVEDSGTRDGPPDLGDVEQVRDKAKELILAHPLAAAGGALAIGALLGIVRARGGKGGALSAAVTGIAMAMVRDAVIRKFSSYANHWIDMKSREEAVSRQREVESFMEH
jgi:hypothetical protein